MKPVRHFIDLRECTADEVKRILDWAVRLKQGLLQGERMPLLERKVLGMIFEKMSLRTRVSFEAGMTHLGGSSIMLEEQHIGFGKRESVADIGRVLSSMVDAIVFRAKHHESVTELAKYCTCPVINALTDRSHPCQALADMLTIQEEFGTLKGVKIVWVGDSNNVAASLIEAAAKLGGEVVISSPEGYQFSDKDLSLFSSGEVDANFSVRCITDPVEAVCGAKAIYTDVWVSMGQENEEAERKKAFANYQVNRELMAKADPDAIFLHCLPARRGLEVTDEVMDGTQSRIVQEASNRMHAQKGMLVWLLNEANA